MFSSISLLCGSRVAWQLKKLHTSFSFHWKGDKKRLLSSDEDDDKASSVSGDEEKPRVFIWSRKQGHVAMLLPGKHKWKCFCHPVLSTVDRDIRKIIITKINLFMFEGVYHSFPGSPYYSCTLGPDWL